MMPNATAPEEVKTPRKLKPHQVVVRPLVTEKGFHKAERCNSYAFEVNPGFIVYLEPTTPLLHGKAVLEKLIFSAKHVYDGQPALAI